MVVTLGLAKGYRNAIYISDHNQDSISNLYECTFSTVVWWMQVTSTFSKRRPGRRIISLNYPYGLLKKFVFRITTALAHSFGILQYICNQVQTHIRLIKAAF